jgi:membrane protein implicated in regulation of membrane protease activity
VDVSIGEWFVLALTCAVGVVGLLLAASGGEGSGSYTIGLMLFVAAVIYAFIFIKRYFDRVDQTRH